MLRTALFAMLFVCSQLALAQDLKPVAAPPAAGEPPAMEAVPVLGVGQPAPKLSIAKWVKGEPVAELAKGKFYVVEFWATWCGPCIAAMPHLTKLQQEYGPKGFTFISVTAEDKNNALETVEKFVAANTAKMGYRVAWDDEHKTTDAWRKAARQNGIPCSFVIDGQGKIAYIGHPITLDDVLPRVVDGTWKGEESVAELRAIDKQFQDIFKKVDEDAAAAFADLAEFEKKYPNRSERIAPRKIIMAFKAKDDARARKWAEEVVAVATERKDSDRLSELANMLCAANANPDKKLGDVAVKAAEAAVKLTDGKEAGALFSLGQAHGLAGDREKAASHLRKAVELADSERTKKYYGSVLKQYETQE